MALGNHVTPIEAMAEGRRGLRPTRPHPLFVLTGHPMSGRATTHWGPPTASFATNIIHGRTALSGGIHVPAGFRGILMAGSVGSGDVAVH